ncbi:J domain-containing protein [Desulfobacter hydrogenophilus]|uniref:J domain-containing protein n=1 Tax=Desulfobacter hydrogenophilus TaxID=2291 RepID=A0A328FD18_9BACT|nr:DnaJ domain-containing protein [Desulfobacter hydrogenophilus]NDY72981.1 DnaJ domain-containing protein [Desulfobacter hydrogenophilus]QBH15243.1 J domain-containing protein [Desulfobacter hydrogenophilus]RAM00927.1 J domain-containing protein [Desulfobacter hydrogenophilus]
MYLAKVKKNGQTTYILRESVRQGEQIVARDIFDIGPCPGAWIDYPGGNAWYLNPDLESRISSLAGTFDSDQFEDLFRPFMRPAIRRATQTFRQRAFKQYTPMTRAQKETIARQVHAFDKRRAHFLKFGNMDQGPMVNMPAVIFRQLHNKSRDEIEQGFMDQERVLKRKDLKSYIYTALDLHRFFKGFMAKQMPHALDQDKVEAFFIQELCLLNKELFGLTSRLHEYLIRYAVMFFDHTYGDSVLLDDMVKDFQFRQRSRGFKPPAATRQLALSQAFKIFNLTAKSLETMDKKDLARKFRRLARQHHPDRGGSHDRFVELNNAYQALLEKIS